jgi:hypothetical protein
MILNREKYGKVVQMYNFNMPFEWNKRLFYNTRYDRETKQQVQFIDSNWSYVEFLRKEIEMESMWRDYFAQNADNKQSNKSYYKAQALKQKLILAESKENQKYSQTNK